MFEHHSQPVAARRTFARRMILSFIGGIAVIVASLAVGTWGYHAFDDLDWIDAFYNATLILTGMGPVEPQRTVAGKLFASAFALYSGVAFVGIVGLVFAPVVHRFLHRFHAQMQDEDADANAGPS
jgi:hypothetical protein